MTTVYGTIGLVVGLLLLWRGWPNGDGTPKPFLRGPLRELLYPVLVLMFLVIGASQFISAV